jgi:hypothetical protein
LGGPSGDNLFVRTILSLIQTISIRLRLAPRIAKLGLRVPST